MDISNEASTDAEETFVKCHQELRDELNNANWHFKIWKYLWELRGTHNEELNQAPAFFGLTIHAHLLAALVRLNKFFDRKEQHLSIRNFLDFIEQNLDIFSNEAFQARMRSKGRYESYIIKDHNEITLQKVEEDRKKVNDLPVAYIRRWRNAVLVHINADCVLRGTDVMKKYPVKQRQIDNIIDTLDDMLNDYSVAYDDVTWAKGLSIEYGMKTVVDAIRFWITETRRQR
jgi:Holliday junction resolvase RusA-like endonuclease